MQLTGAQILIEVLLEQGVDTVFGYPGGAVLTIFDELYKNSRRIRNVITAHEQGAAHAADGYARVSGKTGVVVATSGPGATNLITGIANAYMDSTPLIAITGNVYSDLLGRDSFQEVDIVGITLPITKHSYIVKKAEMLAVALREAFTIANSGRPGPVLVDITKDAQSGLAEYEPQAPGRLTALPTPSAAGLEEAARMIRDSQRPYIYCGGGVNKSNAGEELMALAEKLDAPIGFSMMGLSSIPSSFPYALGMSGMHGAYAATKAAAEADLIIACGVRFSDRATGNRNKFAPQAHILHIDVDPTEINKNVSVALGIAGDIKDTVRQLLPQLGQAARDAWRERLCELKRFQEDQAAPQEGLLTPFQIIDIVNQNAGPQTPVATDVGQHQMWVAQRYRWSAPHTFITSGGLGAMGFGLGAAIGAALATGRRTVLFTGDGSFGMNLNELATAVSQNLPLVVVIMNNGVLGMVRQWQTLFYEGRYAQSTLARRTDFVALARAFGARGCRAETPEQCAACVEAAFAAPGVSVIDCLIGKDERVLPMMPPNGCADDLIIR